MSSWSSCFCNRCNSAVDGSRSANGQNEESVYYDTGQFLSETGFVPLILHTGTSLDRRESVVAGQPLPAPPQAGPRRGSKNGMVHRRRSTFLFRDKLEETTRVQDSPAGYPGNLTETQLDACLEFRRQLKEGDPIRKEMVYWYKEVEEEPYSVCRYLRSRKFDVDKTFEMVDNNLDRWNEGRAHDFYPDPRIALGGADPSALLTQLPIPLGGVSRNGCPVLYLKTGKIQAEGIECVTSLDDDIPNYMWHCIVHKIKRQMADAQGKDPSRFVRVQLTVVVDLQDISYSLLPRVMPVLQKVLSIVIIFPEILFNVVILNTPRFFAPFWSLIKNFLDPATARKFELYSDPNKGAKRLSELISPDELASDFGGSAPSVAELIAKEAGSDVRRQIVEMLTSGKRGEVVCNFKLTKGEAAAITVYTNATDGAIISLSRTEEEDSLNAVTMTRKAKEPEGKAFFRVLTPSLRGPGSYQITVTRDSGPSKEYFVVVGNVTQA